MKTGPTLTHSAAETARHGEDFARHCRTGLVLRLHGDLGAGKTTWIQGLLRGLGSPDEATSPTFALLHEYPRGRLPVFHWDLYRLDEKTDWSQLDLPDQLPGPGLTVVEWPERYNLPWPEPVCVDVRIGIQGGDERLISVEGQTLS